MPNLPHSKKPISQRLTTAIQLALAACCAAGLALALPVTSPLYERTNSIVWVLCGVGLFFLIRYAWTATPTRRDRVYFLAFGFILSFVYMAGRYIYLFHMIDHVLVVLAIALMLTPGVAATLAVLNQGFLRAANPISLGNPRSIFPFLPGKRLFVAVFILLFVCYLPCFLAFYPANLNYDIENQSYQAVTGEFSANHPLLHTLFIKVCLDIGTALLGGYTNGFGLYAIVQMLIMTACFAYALCAIVSLTSGHRIFHWIVLAFFALYPTHHLFAVTTTKDVLTSGALLVSVSAFCRLLLEGERPLKESWPRCLLFLLSSALAMLLRNGMVFAYIIFALCILLFVKRLRTQILLPVLLSIALYYGGSAALKSGLHASDSSPVQMLSIPLQQLVNASLEYPERFTPEEQALFDALIESNQRYLPHISDPIKSRVKKDTLLNNKQAYWQLYVSIGKKAPDSYLNAFLIMNLAIWYPDEITHSDVYTDNQGYLHTGDWYFNYDRAVISVEKHSYLPWLEHLYKKISAENIHQKIPIVSMLFSPGFLCVTMFVLALLILYRRQYVLLLPFAPLFAYWLGLLLAPCIYIRYVYPIIVCLPLFAALTLRAYGPSGSIQSVLKPSDGSDANVC